ncbi:trypsin-2-like [Macrosteles quadrilineatus]|uniref:trypsin-2-like n=1 Tax=Macrosteles quadrilineatus TaxID=74068 RepID=UPI0023E30D8C|nr:trypsin-2-like [Macrosteles quadrilineatus]
MRLFILGLALAGHVIGAWSSNVGSNPAVIQDFPYFASIEKNGVYACAATIIDDKYVMTTFSCVDGVDVNTLGVRVGTSQQGRRGDYYRVVEVNSSRAFPFGPGPSPGPRVAYDVAMVKVAVSFTYYPKVIWANPNADGIQELEEGSVVGWANTKQWGGALSSANAYVLSSNNCSQIYAGIMNISADMFCLWPTDPANSPCFADMGAPFFLNEQYYGIVTHSPGCDNPNLPVVVTGISKLTSFIIMVLCDVQDMFGQLGMQMAGLSDDMQQNLPYAKYSIDM